MNTYKKSFSGKLICFVTALILCLIPVVSYAGESMTENLLINPSGENGASGWEIPAVDLKGSYEGEELLYSTVYQDIPIEENMNGKALQLSGYISTSPDDLEV